LRKTFLCLRGAVNPVQQTPDGLVDRPAIERASGDGFGICGSGALPMGLLQKLIHRCRVAIALEFREKKNNALGIGAKKTGGPLGKALGGPRSCNG